jgi:Ca-activated chloride channel family protein
MNLPRAFLIGLILALPLRASACDLALALAVDVSGSVDAREYRIQMDGLAAGLRDSVVSEALVRSQAQLLLVQWTGSSRQQIAIPWTRIDSFAALEDFAARVESDPRLWRNYSTAIGEALAFTMTTFDDVPDCARHLIDVSGDGPSNEGLDPARMHPALRAAGITVNAIAIEESEPDLTAYFFENVIVGEGAFVVSASGFADYPERIRKKLLREVTRQSAAVQRNWCGAFMNASIACD